MQNMFQRRIRGLSLFFRRTAFVFIRPEAQGGTRSDAAVRLARALSDRKTSRVLPTASRYVVRLFRRWSLARKRDREHALHGGARIRIV
jgi:hypothetical protein